MTRNDKALVLLATGIVVGSVLGILFAKEMRCQSKASVRTDNGAPQPTGKIHSKPTSLKEDIEQAVTEAFAENPEEYA